MGKSCTKEASHDVRYKSQRDVYHHSSSSSFSRLPVIRHSSSASTTTSSSRLSSSASVPLEESGCEGGGGVGGGGATMRRGMTTIDLQPPHSVLLSQVEELSKTFTFYVHIWGVKCRNLSLRNTSDDVGYFVVIDWDDYAFYKKTEIVGGTGPSPKWYERFQFQWSMSFLSKLKERNLIISVYEDDARQGVLLGSTKVDLLTVATGPLHHDVKLEGVKAGVSCGRIIFDIRMAQICQLIINPIEILVHIHEKLEELEETDSGEIFPHSPSATTSSVSSCSSSSLLSKDEEAAAMLLPASSSSFSSSLISGNQQKVNAKAIEDMMRSDSTTSTTTAGEEDQHSSSNSNSSNCDNNSGSGGGDVNSPKATTRREVSAVGGHAEDDEEGPVLAHWQLSFIPTGVDNPAEYFSTWTDLCDQPHWNAVDHSQLVSRHNNSMGGGGARHPSLSSSSQQQVSDGSFLLSQGKAQSLSSNSSNFSSSSVNRHLVHLDQSGTYQKIAALCRRGRLVREVLYDDLPTIQLLTTIDQLRQNHLHLHLYAKSGYGGKEKPLFYGESWLPFFKIYDADVVDRMDKHFFDSFFHEKLWLDGKCIGHIEGIMVFQNNPMVRQMYAGVHTEHGFMRISPPILGAEHKSVKFMFRNQEIVPHEVKKITELHQTLLDTLFSKAQHNPQEAAVSMGMGLGGLLAWQKKSDAVCADLQAVCDSLLHLLKCSDAETRRSFLYHDEDALLSGQRVLLNLGNHVLEYLEYVLWQYRGIYCCILHHVLRRGELDIGTCLPGVPLTVKDLDLAEVFLVYRCVKNEHRKESSSLVERKGRRKRSGVGSGKGEGGGGVSKAKVEEIICGDDGDVDQGEGGGITGRIKVCGVVSVDGLKGRREQEEEVEESSAGPKDLQPISFLSFPSAVSDVNFDPRQVATVRYLELQRRAESLTSDARNQVILFHKRMKLCRQYFLLLHRMLYYALHKLCSDAIFEGQRKFISIFLCIAYFRLPVFREELLKSALNEEEEQVVVEEWRGTEYELDSQSLGFFEKWQPNSELQVLLDWSAFHECLNGYFGEESLMESLRTLKEKVTIPASWKERLVTRGTVFFSFLEHWSKHVYQVVQRKENIRWHTLPGYATLLKALLLEMKSREVTKYPDSLLNCSGAMLANERLLSVFIKVLFLKTSVYHSASVFCAMNYLDYWIQVLTLRGQPLPPNFDFNFLRKGLEIQIGCDLCLNVAKGLWFLYKNLPVFQGEQLRAIVFDLMLEKKFVPIFLNWSWLVRKCYIWFLLFRICEGVRKILSMGLSVTNITYDEKVLVFSYLKLSKYLDQLNAPSVFPQTEALRHLISLIQKKSSCFLLSQKQQLCSTSTTTTTTTTNKQMGGGLLLLSSTTGGRIGGGGGMECSTTSCSHLSPRLGIHPSPGGHTGSGGGGGGRRRVIKNVNYLNNNNGGFYGTQFLSSPNRTVGGGGGGQEGGGGGGKDSYKQQSMMTTVVATTTSSSGSRGSSPSSSVITSTDAYSSTNSEIGNSVGSSPVSVPLAVAAAVASSESGSSIGGGSSPGPPTQFHLELPPLVGERNSSSGVGEESCMSSSSSSPRGRGWGGGGGEGISSLELIYGDDVNFCSALEIPSEYRVYIPRAVDEFSRELNAYREWVTFGGGAHTMPTMHIPALPLDHNVDVPLDAW